VLDNSFRPLTKINDIETIPRQILPSRRHPHSGAESDGAGALQGLASFLKGLGASRVMAMVAVTATLIGFFGFVIMRATAPQMTTLFTDLSSEDSSGIIKDLERQAIPFELRNEGAVIMVPKDKVTRLRMKLAESGLPKGGGVGYEIFDKSDALGTTSFVQNINHLRALEGELARTIRAIDRIQAARVHLVLPERPLFSRETPEPSASIVVRVRGTLDPQQVRAIRHVVASAVNGLKPQRVSIVDEAGQLLADGAGENSAEGGNGDERRAAFEKRMRNQVEAIVSSVVGVGRARVQLSADFDYNKVTQTSDRYDPEGRVLRSSQSREESSATADSKDGQVTVANELPGAAGGASATARDQSKKSEETNNYEISRTTKTEVTEAGRVNRISVAVLVDGIYAKNEKGETIYQERTKDQIDRIAALVRSAIGFDQKRGDQVEVVNLKFAEAPTVVPLPEHQAGLFGMLQFNKDDIMYGIELGVMLLLGLVVLFMVIRPLMKRVLASEQPLVALGHAGAVPALTDAAGTAMTAPGQTLVPSGHGHGQMINVAQVQGQLNAQAVHRVGELADANPTETASIIRQWLSEPA
jgi:flagellar M-ring protein FliF